MKRNNFKSLEAAKHELLVHGFWPTHAPVGNPEPWKKKGKPLYMIGKQTKARSTRWHIVKVTT